MKPLRLSIRAFGPFADAQELDFSDLAGHEFFLIHGPTGAGKTSILDAISYALYGETSGGLRDAKDMRSHFADPSTPTKVAFEFQLGGKTYRVERFPDQQVPKLKGGGFKKQAANAGIWELAEGREIPLASEKPSAVDAKVAELMGFKAGPFRQVVILPQGQFQEFLLASSLERQSILQVLFQTSRYARITEALAAKAQALKDEIRSLLAADRQLLDQAQVQTSDELDARIDGLREKLLTLDVQKLEASTQRDTAAAELQEGHRISALVKEREEAALERQTLEGQAPEIEAQRVRLDRARRADRVMPLIRTLDEAETALARLREEEQTLQQDFSEATQTQEQAQAQLESAKRQEPQRENLRRTIERLKELEPQLQQMEQLREELRSITRDRLSQDGDIQRQQKRVEMIEQSLSNFQARQQELQLEAQRVDVLEFQLQQDKKRRRNREEFDRTELDLARAKDTHAEAQGVVVLREQEAMKARQAADHVRGLWDTGQAAILASHLASGSPCLVCGSSSHPHPAKAAGLLPTEAELKQAQTRLEDAKSALDRAVSIRNQRELAIQPFLTRIELLRDAFEDEGDQNLEALAQLEAQHKQELESARRAAEELAPIARKLETLAADRSQALDSLQALQATLATTRSREDMSRGALQTLEASILADLRVPGALSTKLDQARQDLAELEAKREQAQAAQEATMLKVTQLGARLDAHRARCREAMEDKAQLCGIVEDGLRQALFRDRSDFESARRDEQAQQAMEAAIRLHGETLASARDRHQRAMDQAGTLDQPNLLALQASLEQAQSTVEHCAKELVRTQEEEASLKRLRQALADNARNRREQEHRYTILGRLARVARGEDGARVSFERFVQGAILDEVLISASHRLRRMSRNRYSLQRAQAPGDLRRAGGLDLEVPDAHTGKARAASTLSGGEGFQASLALALGLSDVVQRHAGGVRLDTVFVDEGFGSLDSEALELALRTLEDLKQGGRLVGIISHLDEVKQRIAARLEIQPGPRGSRAAFRLG
jgi:exonuclease SbcC